MKLCHVTDVCLTMRLILFSLFIQYNSVHGIQLKGHQTHHPYNYCFGQHGKNILFFRVWLLFPISIFTSKAGKFVQPILLLHSVETAVRIFTLEFHLSYTSLYLYIFKALAVSLLRNIAFSNYKDGLSRRIFSSKTI